MVKLLKILLTYKFRTAQPAQENGGFTLIEVLVGLVLAFLIITPLLGFMVNLLQTDRQEQAKANSEQEIQAAADYISRDLEQAVYIYDGYGLNKIKDQLPTPDSNSVPVLVFWKRQIITQIKETTGGKDDAFVYALVAYYLRKSDPNKCATDTWSCTARITRIQLQDAVEKDLKTNEPIDIADARGNATPGFKLFDPSKAITREAAMNAWKSTIDPSSINPQVLIDYIDQTPIDANTQCPDTKRTSLPDNLTLAEYNTKKYQQVPASNSVQGFWACIDVDNTSATVTMRGNALARTRKKTDPTPYVASQSAYFPSVRFQVQGNGVFSINQKS